MPNNKSSNIQSFILNRIHQEGHPFVIKQEVMSKFKIGEKIASKEYRDFFNSDLAASLPPELAEVYRQATNGKIIPLSVRKRIQKGAKNEDIARILGCSVKHVNRVRRKLKFDGTNKTDEGKELVQEEKEWESGLISTETYVYNKENDSYIVFLKAAGKNVVVKGDMHRGMLQSYSNWNGEASTINEICRTHKIPRAWFVEYKEIFGWTHDKEPFTDEQLINEDEDSLIDDALQQKRFNVYQKFNKKAWEQTQQNAQNWHEFLAKRVDPFQRFVEQFDSRYVLNYKPVLRKDDNRVEKEYVIGLSDVHFGNNADKDVLYHQESCDIEATSQDISLFLSKIQENVQGQKAKFNTCHVLFMGDILDSLTGYTEKGTRLDSFPIGEKQFTYAFNALSHFLSQLGRIFPSVNVKCVMGNHSYYGDWALYQCLSKFFSKTDFMKFEICTQRWHPFKIKSSLFIMEHGYSPFYKSKVPAQGSSRDAYVQNLFMSRPEMLIGVNQKYFLTADRHTLQVNESNNFEFIQFSTMVRGNRYADNSNWKSRPRQNALIVSESGVESIVNFYFK